MGVPHVMPFSQIKPFVFKISNTNVNSRLLISRKPEKYDTLKYQFKIPCHKYIYNLYSLSVNKFVLFDDSYRFSSFLIFVQDTKSQLLQLSILWNISLGSISLNKISNRVNTGFYFVEVNKNYWYNFNLDRDTKQKDDSINQPILSHFISTNECAFNHSFFLIFIFFSLFFTFLIVQIALTTNFQIFFTSLSLLFSKSELKMKLKFVRKSNIYLISIFCHCILIVICINFLIESRSIQLLEKGETHGEQKYVNNNFFDLKNHFVNITKLLTFYDLRLMKMAGISASNDQQKNNLKFSHSFRKIRNKRSNSECFFKICLTLIFCFYLKLRSKKSSNVRILFILIFMSEILLLTFFVSTFHSDSVIKDDDFDSFLFWPQKVDYNNKENNIDKIFYSSYPVNQLSLNSAFSSYVNDESYSTNGSFKQSKYFNNYFFVSDFCCFNTIFTFLSNTQVFFRNVSDVNNNNNMNGIEYNLPIDRSYIDNKFNRLLVTRLSNKLKFSNFEHDFLYPKDNCFTLWHPLNTSLNFS